MKNSVDMIKTAVFFIVLFLIGFGRWVNMVAVHHWSWGSAALVAAAYGFPVALLACFITDLVRAKGFLQRRILFRTTAGDELPPGYLRRNPVKTFLETLFRLFPYPGPTALYKIGKPSEDSPVLVTGNYDLTARRVISTLYRESPDCWLLVCNSRGINIWCSSLADHFGTSDIITAIKSSHLAEKVKHNTIILPQLCAANISVQQIKKETGFVSRFGPLKIQDISRYFQDPGNRDIRRASFDLNERLEMAVGCPLILIVLLTFIYNFAGLRHLPVIIPVIYALTVLHAVIFPYRIIRPIIPWSLFCGSVVFIAVYFIFPGFISLGNNIAISLGMTYIVNEFSGWSPLLKYSLIPYEKAQIEIDRGLCTGCFRCIEVCPKAVYEIEDRKSHVVNGKACVLCKSCFRQCPAGAITHSCGRGVRAG